MDSAHTVVQRLIFGAKDSNMNSISTCSLALAAIMLLNLFGECVVGQTQKEAAAPSIPTGDHFTIQTPQGVVTVKNFYPTALIVGPQSLVVDVNSFSVSYDGTYHIFFITVRGESRNEIIKHRKEAEGAFLQLLEVTPKDACRLHVELSYWGAGVLAFDPNSRLPLSFCASTSEQADQQSAKTSKKNNTNQISAESDASDSNNWTELNRGQTKGAFQFSRRRTLLYNGRPILGIRFRPSVQKIAVSPPAVGGKYAICVTFDDIESAAFLLRLDNHSGKQLALQGPPSVWAAWSPAGTHAVIGSYYEADEALYSINLPSGIMRRFSFKVSKQTEEESSDLDNLTWVDDRVFRVRVTVNCNPYTDDNCSDQDRKKVLREYEVRANVVTIAVSSERIR
jgi:hypothetical protein